MTSPKDHEMAHQLSAKDCHFIQSILHNLLSSGAKVDWNAIAKECEYKTGPSAYMGFSRIKKKLGWVFENGNQDKPAANGKAGTKRRAPPTKKAEPEHGGDELNGETGEDDGPTKKRAKRNIIKQEEVVDVAETVPEQGEAFAEGAAAI